MKLLLVDDDAPLRQVVQILLKTIGYEVAGEASGGNEALRMFQLNPGMFDGVFTDCEMPDGGGIELINNIKKISPMTPVIMASGKAISGDPYGYIRNGLQAGAIAVLEKPFNLNLLRQALEEAFSGKELAISPL